MYLDSSGELKDNSGYARRLNDPSNGKNLELYERLHADLFSSHKMLINSLDTNIMLAHAPESFYHLVPSYDNKVRIKILDATLFITQVELKPPLLLAHDNVLGMRHKAHYHVTYTQIETLL